MRRLTLVKTVLGSLKLHPGRAALTALGIMIGVGSVITVLAIGAGSRQQLEQRLQSIGANLLLVLPGTASGSGGQNRYTKTLLTSADSEAIRDEIAGLLAVAPSVYRRQRTIYGNANWETTVQGVTNDYLIAREWALLAGRKFTADELGRGVKVAILGQTARKRLFEKIDPMDRIIRIRGLPFTVIGTLAAKGPSSVGSDQDDKILIPLLAAQKALDGGRKARLGAVQYIMLKVDSADGIDAVADQVGRLLRQRHRRPGQSENDFEVRNLAELQETRKAASAVFGRALLAVAMISLVVGGISVMNTMLVSVSERTREIGLRMALGARSSDIRNQFLLEAVILTLCAGAIGVACGIGASHAIAASAWLEGLD